PRGAGVTPDDPSGALCDRGYAGGRAGVALVRPGPALPAGIERRRPRGGHRQPERLDRRALSQLAAGAAPAAGAAAGELSPARTWPAFLWGRFQSPRAAQRPRRVRCAHRSPAPEYLVRTAHPT